MKLVPATNGWICPDDPGEPGLGVPRWSVNEREARIVSEFFRGLDVLEIGTGLGIATIAIAEKARKVHTVDIDKWVKETVAPTLPENVVFYTNIRSVPTGLDAAFIDGLHTYDQCVIDTKDARKIVKPGGIILYHDANMKAIMRVLASLNPTRIDTRAGLAITWNE